MVDQKAVELVLRLHKNTKNKKLTWTPTFQPDLFEATFPQYSVRLEKVFRRDSVDYEISIRNDQGVEVERFSDVDLTNEFVDEAPGGSWFAFMGEIHEMARRQALRADDAIDAILGELE